MKMDLQQIIPKTVNFREFQAPVLFIFLKCLHIFQIFINNSSQCSARASSKFWSFWTRDPSD